MRRQPDRLATLHPLPGDYSCMEPPDPIPNSEVKRTCADGSVHLACESRSSPGFLPKTPAGIPAGVFFVWNFEKTADRCAVWRYCSDSGRVTRLANYRTSGQSTSVAGCAQWLCDIPLEWRTGISRPSKALRICAAGMQTDSGRGAIPWASWYVALVRTTCLPSGQDELVR